MGMMCVSCFTFSWVTFRRVWQYCGGVKVCRGGGGGAEEPAASYSLSVGLNFEKRRACYAFQRGSNGS